MNICIFIFFISVRWTNFYTLQYLVCVMINLQMRLTSILYISNHMMKCTDLILCNFYVILAEAQQFISLSLNHIQSPKTSTIYGLGWAGLGPWTAYNSACVSSNFQLLFSDCNNFRYPINQTNTAYISMPQPSLWIVKSELIPSSLNLWLWLIHTTISQLREAYIHTYMYQ